MLREDLERVRELPIAEAHKVVMFTLLSFRNGKTGQCNPSKRLLARILDVSESVVYERVRWLIRAGYVRVVEFGGGKGRTTSYELAIDVCARRSRPKATDESGRIAGTPSANPAPGNTVSNPAAGRNPAENPAENPAAGRNRNKEERFEHLEHTASRKKHAPQREGGFSDAERARLNIERICDGS